jgi:alkylation response protein AidB-like acyl-CoA dehydrogenase
MNFELTDEQKMMQEAARKFAQERIAKVAVVPPLFTNLV